MKRISLAVSLLMLLPFVYGCTYSEKRYYINSGGGAVTIKSDDTTSAQKTPTINPNIEIPLIK